MIRPTPSLRAAHGDNPAHTPELLVLCDIYHELRAMRRTSTVAMLAQLVTTLTIAAEGDEVNDVPESALAIWQHADSMVPRGDD